MREMSTNRGRQMIRILPLVISCTAELWACYFSDHPTSLRLVKFSVQSCKWFDPWWPIYEFSFGSWLYSCFLRALSSNLWKILTNQLRQPAGSYINWSMTLASCLIFKYTESCLSKIFQMTKKLKFAQFSTISVSISHQAGRNILVK